jgi:hypothetical protein
MLVGYSVLVSHDDDVLWPGYAFAVEHRAVLGDLTGKSELFGDALLMGSPLSGR